jgi:hypothetical protein
VLLARDGSLERGQELVQLLFEPREVGDGLQGRAPSLEEVDQPVQGMRRGRLCARRRRYCRLRRRSRELLVRLRRGG